MSKILRTFAPAKVWSMENNTNISTLEWVLSLFFDCITKNDQDVDGLHGEFAALSGNALLLQMAHSRKILALPPEIDFKGTMIMVRIPAQVPNGFNIYDYMS